LTEGSFATTKKVRGPPRMRIKGKGGGRVTDLELGEKGGLEKGCTKMSLLSVLKNERGG